MPHKHRYSNFRPDTPITIDLVDDGQKEAHELKKRKDDETQTALHWINAFTEFAAKYFDVVQTPAGRAAAAPIATKAYTSLRGLSSSANRNGGIPVLNDAVKKPKVHADFVIPHFPSSPAGASVPRTASSPPGPEQKTPEAAAPLPTLADSLQRQSTF